MRGGQLILLDSSQRHFIPQNYIIVAALADCMPMPAKAINVLPSRFPLSWLLFFCNAATSL
jgi:hypothetical protein